MKIKPDEEYSLVLQLGSREDGLYPRATIYDANNQIFAQQALGHISNGLYKATVSFPETGQYIIIYEVFEDQEFTQQSLDYPDSIAEVVFVEDEVDTKLNAIEGIVNSILNYVANDQKIDVEDNSLIIYEADGVTPFAVFKLYDRFGNPSVSEIIEKRKVSQ